jgi:hypothetical protein
MVVGPELSARIAPSDSPPPSQATTSRRPRPPRHSGERCAGDRLIAVNKAALHACTLPDKHARPAYVSVRALMRHRRETRNARSAGGETDATADGGSAAWRSRARHRWRANLRRTRRTVASGRGSDEF